MIASLAAAVHPLAPSSYGDSYGSSQGAASATALVFLMLGIYAVIILVIWLASGFAWAGLFGKAGHPKWAAFVPLYNTWIIVKISGRPESHFWLQFIPYAGIYWAILSLNDLAKSFGKDVAYTVGLIFVPVVFASILSYGSARYLGPAYVSPEQKLYYQQQQSQYFQQQQYAQQQPQYGQQPQQSYPPQPSYGDQQQYGQQPPYGNQPPYGSGPTQQS